MKCLFFSILGLSLLAGCGVEPGENLGRADAIESGWIVISADADRAYVDRVITVTTRCRPLIRGKGKISIVGAAEWRADTKWSIDSPVRDTVVGKESEYTPVEIPVVFEPGADFVQQWRVQLYPQGGHGAYGFYFEAQARVDSVFMADSSRCFPIESPEVLTLSPYGRGYEPGAGSTILWLEKP